MKKLLTLCCASVLALGWVFAGTNTTLYYSISEADRNGYTVKCNTNHKGDGDDWHGYNMTNTGKTYKGNPIWTVNFTDTWGGLGCIQFQLYDGATWKSEVQVFGKYTWTSSDTYNNKLWVKGGSSWLTYQYDCKVTFGSNDAAMGTVTAVSGAASIKSEGSVLSGNTVTLTATPAGGYVVEAWYSDAECTNMIQGTAEKSEYTTAKLEADITIYVKFTQAMAADKQKVEFLNTNLWETVLCTPADGEAVSMTATSRQIWASQEGELAVYYVYTVELDESVTACTFGNGTEVTVQTTIAEGMYCPLTNSWGNALTVTYGDNIAVSNVAEDAVLVSGAAVWSGSAITFVATSPDESPVKAWYSDEACTTVIEEAGIEASYSTTVTADMGVYVAFELPKLSFINRHGWSNVYFYTWTPGSDPVVAWPGTRLSATGKIWVNENGTLTQYDYYTTTAVEGKTNCLFTSSNNGPQTNDLTVTGNQYFMMNGSASKSDGEWKHAYTVTVGEGVTVKVKAGSTFVSESLVREGANLTFAATVPEGQKIEGWYSDEALTERINDAGTDGTYQVGQIKTNTSVYVKFVQEGGGTDLDNLSAEDTQSRKFIQNGQLLIQRGNHLFNAFGQQIR